MIKISPNLILVIFCIKIYSQSINVPIDYNNSERGVFKLEYEFGLPYNSDLPTVIVVADAQQFYVKKDRLKKIQDELFGNKINVLGIIPRNNNEDLKQKLQLNNNDVINWKLAYTVFNSFQYANDIEQIKINILKDNQDIYLYGQSGGAFLITEYLSVFPNTDIKKVFLGASVNPIIENKLGINHDNFQRDFLNSHKESKRKMGIILKDEFFDRNLISNLFQRQNFFVELDNLNDARVELIEKLYNKDTLYIQEKKEAYQIDAINNFLESEIGIPIRVRLFEFIKPLLKNREIENSDFYPDMENSYNIARPLIENASMNYLSFKPTFNEKRFKKFKGEVFLLSGRYDHIADYRSSIYLSALLKRSYLFIAKDDHTFKHLKSEDGYSKIIQNFFLENYSNNWISRYKQYKWFEK